MRQSARLKKMLSVKSNVFLLREGTLKLQLKEFSERVH